MSDISYTIAKAIKEAKWLAVDYTNKEGVLSQYWCAIKDIDINTKSFTITAYNIHKYDNETSGILDDVKLYFERINNAYVLDHTSYKQPQSLIDKIETNLDSLTWLKYDLFDEGVLNYIKECIFYEATPYQDVNALLPRIDGDELLKEKFEQGYVLSFDQLKELTEKIESTAKNTKKSRGFAEIVINELGIETRDGLFVCAYRKLEFDPSQKKLLVDKEVSFNYQFAKKDKDINHSLASYLDVTVDEFASLFMKDKMAAVKMLNEPLKKKGQELNLIPYIMELRRNNLSHVENEFNAIIEAKNNKKLSTPLKAFFGNIDRRHLNKKREFDIVLKDDNINVDQLRVIHNALNQPVTYVQGPPGTGKTQSIVHLIISAIYNKKKVLVSSNNNKPIDDIYKKFEEIKYREKPIPFPILRLGNEDNVKESLKQIQKLMHFVKRLTPDEVRLSELELSSKNKMDEINHLIDDYEERKYLEEELDEYEKIHKLLENTTAESFIESEIALKRKELNRLRIVDDSIVKEKIAKLDERFIMYLNFIGVRYIKRLYGENYRELRQILDITDEEVRLSKFNSYIKKHENFEGLQKAFPIIMTTNQSAYRLGDPKPSFDLTIIDEAGQCSIGHALFPIIRGESLLLVGDRMQLRPVITINPEVNERIMTKHEISKEYNYLSNSILSTMEEMDKVSKRVILRFHYRSSAAIISFSNNEYYEKNLIIETKHDDLDDSLKFVNVPQPFFGFKRKRHVSEKEARTIVDLIKKEQSNKSIGVIAPFRNQAVAIRKMLEDNNIKNVTVGTVHTFQGDEKDIIYFSPAISSKITEKTFDWIKDHNELINVAITRARKNFVMVGDFKEIEKRSKESNQIFKLMMHLKNQGKVIEADEKSIMKNVQHINYVQYLSENEELFLKTLKHALSFNSDYTVQVQVKLNALLSSELTEREKNFALKSSVDFVIFKGSESYKEVVLAVELNGPEHIEDGSVRRRDALKAKLLKENNIKLLNFKNENKLNYVLLKDILLNAYKLKIND